MMTEENNLYDQTETDIDEGSFEDIAIHMSLEDHPSFRLTFTVTPNAMAHAKFRDPQFEAPEVDTVLAHFQADNKRLVFYPTVTSPGNLRFLGQKYGIRTITLENQEDVPFSEEGGGSIEGLPFGFIHDPHQ